MVVVAVEWLRSVVSEETATTQQLQSAFSAEQLRLYSTTTPFPEDWLTSQEQTFFDKLKHPKRQASWLLGRTLLKFLAYQHPNLLPQDTKNPLDTLIAWQFPHPQCSISHTPNVAYGLVNLNGITTGSIGLDVEEMGRKPLSLKVLAYLLSETERLDFKRLQLKNPDERWDLRYWTGKEALYKATPVGHQGHITLNCWQLERLNTVTMSEAHVQTKTGELLKATVFNTVTYCLEGSCSLSIALVCNLGIVWRT